MSCSGFLLCPILFWQGEGEMMLLPVLNSGTPEHTLRFSFSWGKAFFMTDRLEMAD